MVWMPCFSRCKAFTSVAEGVEDLNMNSFPRFENAILSQLPEEIHQRLAPYMEMVELRAGEVLHEVGSPAQPVCFLENGIGSETLVGDNGMSIELVVMGSEGIMGERAIFGRFGMTQNRCLMFTDATAYKVPPGVISQEFQRGGVLQELILARIESRLIEISQNVLCAQYHSAEQRMSRWLLTLAYRSHSDTFEVTHEHISNMLGVRRPTVSELAGRLKEAGMIEYSRGAMKILDMQALEMKTCECYKVVKEATHLTLSR